MLKVIHLKKILHHHQDSPSGHLYSSPWSHWGGSQDWKYCSSVIYCFYQQQINMIMYTVHVMYQ